MKEISGWEIKKTNSFYGTYYHFYTNIQAPQNDLDNSLCFGFKFYFDSRYTYNRDIKPEVFFHKNKDNTYNLYVNGKRKKYEFTDRLNLEAYTQQEIIDTLTEWCNKKVVRANLAAKKRKNKLSLNNIENEDFICKMNELASKHNTNFVVNGINDWTYDNNININYCKSDQAWRVRVNEINYSYFKCKDLEEVYKVCNWFAEIPVHATYKF